jgi:hypothetical protein
MTEQHVVISYGGPDMSGPDRPSQPNALVTGFSTEAEATQWARDHLPNGMWDLPEDVGPTYAEAEGLIMVHHTEAPIELADRMFDRIVEADEESQP